MADELSPLLDVDPSLPRFFVPAEVREWGAKAQLAARSRRRVIQMLAGTSVAVAGAIAAGELVDRWWGWLVCWVVLVAAMIRLDAIHHEAVHRALFHSRLANDLTAMIAGALEGFHAPTYRCFHLAHHALTRSDGVARDPEGFYDELITSPLKFGRLTLPARAVYVGGVVIGGVTFALQLVVDTVRTMVGAPPDYVRAASWVRHVRRWAALPVLIWAGLAVGFVRSGHSAELVRWWLVPMAAFWCGPSLYFAVAEHYAAEHGVSMVRATGSVESNAVYRWIALSGNYHLAHHVFPGASWWRLAEADRHLATLSDLRYDGYLAFHRKVWNDLARRPSP